MPAPLGEELPLTALDPSSTALWRAAVDLFPDACFLIVAFEARPTIADCNRAACARLGYTRAELVGRPLQLIGPAARDTAAQAEDLAALERGETVSYATVRRRKDGSHYPVVATLSLVSQGGQTLVTAADRVADEAPAPSAYETLLQERELLARQTEAHDAFTACLRAIQRPAPDTPARLAIIGDVIASLRAGLGAARVRFYRLAGDRRHAAGLTLGVELDRERGLTLGQISLVDEGLWPGETAGPAESESLSASLQATLPADEHEALAITEGARLWGCLTIVPDPCRPLDGPKRALAATVAGALSSAVRRWMAVDRLAASEQRLRLALEAADLGVWEWDLGSGLVLLSERAAQIANLSGAPAPIPYEQLNAAIHPDDRDGLQQAVQAAGIAVPFQREVRIFRKDGSISRIAIYSQRFVGSLEDGGRVIGVVADVTAGRQAEEEARALQIALEQRVRERTSELELANRSLRANQRFTERLLEASPSKVYVWDKQAMGIIYSSMAYERLLGYTSEQLQALGGDFPLPQLMHAEDMAKIPAQVQYQQTMADDEVYEREYRLRHADGSWRWFRTHEVIFKRDEAGAPLQILGQVLDITARKQTEEDLARAAEQLRALNAELRRSSSLLTTIINSLEDGLVLVGPDKVVLLVNEALCAIYDREAAEVVGRPWEATCPITTAQIEQSLATGLPGGGRGRIRRSNGTLLTIDFRTLPLASADRAVDQVVLHITDVTARLEFEELALTNERLATSGRLAAIVAHEVNSPLQAIQNTLFLASTDNREERTGYLAMIAEEIDRVGGLIRRLHEFNRPGASEALPIDVAALIERVLALVGNTMARQRIGVAFLRPPTLPPLIARADQLTQVLLNLFLNAVDAMPHGGTLTVCASLLSTSPEQLELDPLASEAIVIEVSDSGSGIAPEVLQRIFDPFVTTKQEGSGLGLAISRQIVEQHRGTISVRNEPAGGATFTIALPTRVMSEREQTL